MTEFKINFELNDKNKKSLNFIISDLLKCSELCNDPIQYAKNVLYYGDYIEILNIQINKKLYEKGLKGV